MANISCSHVADEQELLVKIGEVDIEHFESLKHNEYRLPKYVELAPGMAYITKLNRKTFTLREGPGTQFYIKDQIVAKNENLIAIGIYGVWRKVISVDTHVVGWIHSGAIERLELNETPIKVPASAIPTKVVISRVNELKSFKSKEKVSAEIGKGTIFYTLHSNRRRSLVWDPSANVTFWVERKFLR